MTRHVCIHGHFHQPPRENPWLGSVERQADPGLFDRLTAELPFEVDLWRAQNTFYRAVHLTYPELTERAAAGDDLAEVWVAHFRRLGDALGVAVEEGAAR